MQLSITKEKVLEAAAKCSTAKATLEVLFPEVFEDLKAVNCTAKGLDVKTAYSNALAFIDKASGETLISTAISYAPDGYQGNCFFLGYTFDWEFVQHNNKTILIPRRK